MDRWSRMGPAGRPEVVAPAAAALSTLLLAGAFAAGWATGPGRVASAAAAAALLVIVAVGLYLYAWRLGAPGRSGDRGPGRE